MNTGELKAPFNPKVKSENDLKNFEKIHTSQNLTQL